MEGRVVLAVPFPRAVCSIPSSGPAPSWPVPARARLPRLQQSTAAIDVAFRHRTVPATTPLLGAEQVLASRLVGREAARQPAVD